ncbi:hypothetical protein HDU79_010611 [Rhizoclosmatium sp. JEL0117]|nr:hypothetical protein HDU79_010611 [Rhizoclosmatium sp. JEL0117]
MFNPQITPFAIQNLHPGLSLQTDKPKNEIQDFSLFPIKKEIPAYLSKRFTRTKKGPKRGGASRGLAAEAGDSVDGSNNGLEKVGTPTTPGGNKKIGGGGMNLLGGGEEEKSGGRRKETSGDGEEATPVAINPDESYSPFHLADKSSFNPARLNSRQLRNMDRLTKAKYQAYDKPTAEIIQNIDESSARAKIWNKQEHKKLIEQCDLIRTLLARKRGLVSESEESIALNKAQLATDRMKDKIKNMTTARENELAFLVEGQPNAIDAIRLKEYLTIKANPIKLSRTFTDRDRLRVEELLSIRSQAS